MTRSASLPLCCWLLYVLLAGCGEGEAAPPAQDSATAVMASLLVPGPEGSNFYIGVYPKLPKQLDTAQMLEVPSGFDARAFDGAIFVWEGESGTYTRYGVSDDLQLSRDATVSFRELGGTGVAMTAFVAKDRAYSLTRDEHQIIVWNPEAMEVVGAISGDALVDPKYPELDYGEPVVFGDSVAWPIQWTDYDNNRFSRELGVVLVSTKDMDPAEVVRDTRCGGGWMLFVDDAGDLYAAGNAISGYAHLFGEDAATYPADCVARMRAGTRVFDADYKRDLNVAAGSPAIYHTWHVAEHTLLAAVLDSETDLSSLDADEYWTTPMQRKLLLVDDESSRELPGVPKSSVWSTLGQRIDDSLYMLSVSGAGETAASKLYAITESGAELTVTADGYLWSIGRIR
jgi:hypothetical protein